VFEELKNVRKRRKTAVKGGKERKCDNTFSEISSFDKDFGK